MILVTDGQMRQALAITRSLGKKGLEVMVGDSEKLSISFFSKYASKKIVYPDPLTDEQAYIDFILELAKRENIEMIIPVRDKTLLPLSKCIDRFCRYVELPILGYDKIMIARDKAQTVQAAQKIGIPVPKTFFPESLDDLNDIKEFPVVIKPRQSSGSRGLSICRDQEELKQKFLKTQKDYSSGLIIQEYIPSDNEISFYGLFDEKSSLVAHTTQKRLRSYPVDHGPSTLRVIEKNDQVSKYGKEILSRLGWQGVAMAEFRIDKRDGVPKLMEINPRFWGSLALSIAAGVDFPYLLYNMAVKKDVSKRPQQKNGVKCRWLLPGDILWFLSAKKSWKNIKDFFSFKGYYYDIINKDDIVPIVGFILVSLKYLFSRKGRSYVFRKIK